MASFEFLAIILTGLGLTASLLYYSNIIKNNEKARQRQLVIQRSQIYSLEYMKTYNEIKTYTDWTTPEEWINKYGRDANPDAYSKWLYIIRIYSLAGLLLREGADPDLIFELYAFYAVIGLWEQFESVILYRRELNNNPNLDDSFEFLYREAKKRYPDISIHQNRFPNKP